MFSSTAKLVTKIIFFINLANLAFLFTHLSWDTFLKIPTMQNAFFDHEVLKWNLTNMFYFTELEKLWVFFLKPDLITKLNLLKPTVLLATMVIIMATMVIVNKDYGNAEWFKDFENHQYWSYFFSIWVFFHEHSWFTGQQGNLFNSSLPLPPVSQTRRY